MTAHSPPLLFICVLLFHSSVIHYSLFTQKKFHNSLYRLFLLCRPLVSCHQLVRYDHVQKYKLPRQVCKLVQQDLITTDRLVRLVKVQVCCVHEEESTPLLRRHQRSAELRFG
jgi:hypothetical protein